MFLTYPYFKQAIMYSPLILVRKIKSKSLREVQTFNNNQFLQIGALSGVLHEKEKPGDFNLINVVYQD